MEAVASIPRRARWSDLPSAMVRSGGSAVAGAVLSAVSVKIFAGVAGPAGLGLLATLQQMRQTALVAASVNGQTALVQGSSARIGLEQAQYLRTVLLIVGLATALMAGTMLAAPNLWASFAGLGAERAYLIRWLTVVLVPSVALVILTALLNARGEIGRVALVQLISPLVMSLLAYPVAVAAKAGTEVALVGLMIVAAASASAVAALGLWPHRSLLQAAVFGRPWWNPAAARSFFAVAATMFVTGLLGSAALLAVRNRILDDSGLAVTGHFDAAWSISMNQVTLVLSSMQTFFLPTLARAADSRERSAHVGHGLLVAAAVVAPVAALLALFKPQVIAALYSAEFQSTARYLRWTLLGDYLKVASWILSVPMLAAADMRGFLLADGVAYGTFLLTSAILTRWLVVAEAAACGFVLMYAVHLVVCFVLVSTRHEIRISARTAGGWLAGLAGLALVSAWSWEVQ